MMWHGERRRCLHPRRNDLHCWQARVRVTCVSTVENAVHGKLTFSRLRTTDLSNPKLRLKYPQHAGMNTAPSEKNP
ncbi:uncharacterized [Tachysurus ichikawai]